MTAKAQFLSKRQRYQPISLPQNFSDEEMARNWALLAGDRQEIKRYRKSSHLYMAIQICAVRLYDRFLQHVHDLPPSLTVEVPEREATYLEHRQNVLKHLGRQQFDQIAQEQFTTWIERQAQLGILPEALFLLPRCCAKRDVADSPS